MVKSLSNLKKNKKALTKKVVNRNRNRNKKRNRTISKKKKLIRKKNFQKKVRTFLKENYNWDKIVVDYQNQYKSLINIK